MESVTLRAHLSLWPKVEGRRSPPIMLQETKNLAFQPFTRRPKSKGRRNLKCVLLDEGDKPSKEVWVGQEAIGYFSLENQPLTRSLLLGWRGCFGKE